MLISSESVRRLSDSLAKEKDSFCKGLFLSARWFVVASIAKTGTSVIILPDKENAEYCTSDLYNLIEGDRVFFLPDSGKGVERSNYKSSLSVQRTSAIGKIISNKDNSDPLFIVTYPEAISEKIFLPSNTGKFVFRIKTGEEIDFDSIQSYLSGEGFEKVDFVSSPGQYSIRGSIIDIFSYSFNFPFRLSFWGNEVEKIHVFDCNTQLSKEEVSEIEVFPKITAIHEIATIFFNIFTSFLLRLT